MNPDTQLAGPGGPTPILFTISLGGLPPTAGFAQVHLAPQPWQPRAHCTCHTGREHLGPVPGVVSTAPRAGRLHPIPDATCETVNLIRPGEGAAETTPPFPPGSLFIIIRTIFTRSFSWLHAREGADVASLKQPSTIIA